MFEPTSKSYLTVTPKRGVLNLGSVDPYGPLVGFRKSVTLDSKDN